MEYIPGSLVSVSFISPLLSQDNRKRESCNSPFIFLITRANRVVHFLTGAWPHAWAGGG